MDLKVGQHLLSDRYALTVFPYSYVEPFNVSLLYVLRFALRVSRISNARVAIP